MRFLLPFLMLALCGCCEAQKTNVSLEKRQEAIAKEIISIEYTFGETVFQLNNTKAVGFVVKAESLTDRLDKTSKELDTLGRFPIGLRKATLEKLDDDEKALAKLTSSKKIDLLQPEAVKITMPAAAKYFSARASVIRKAGLYWSNSIDTNGVEPPKMTR